MSLWYYSMKKSQGMNRWMVFTFTIFVYFHNVDRFFSSLCVSSKCRNKKEKCWFQAITAKKVRLCRRRLCFRFVDHFCKLRFAGCIFCRDKNSASICSTGIQAVFALNIFKKRLPANRLFCFLLVSLSERDFIPVYRAEKTLFFNL